MRPTKQSFLTHVELILQFAQILSPIAVTGCLFEIVSVPCSGFKIDVVLLILENLEINDSGVESESCTKALPVQHKSSHRCVQTPSALCTNPLNEGPSENLSSNQENKKIIAVLSTMHFCQNFTLLYRHSSSHLPFCLL